MTKLSIVVLVAAVLVLVPGGLPAWSLPGLPAGDGLGAAQYLTIGPSAFTPYATNPVPPESNTLSVSIEAGQKTYSAA